jgi:signal transduction histidine kinase
VLRVQRAGAHVDLLVEDTGIGIAESDLPRITEPFFRGDKARTAHVGGAGLGLTIVKSTMEDHGGTLKVSSHAGAGTLITLRFPATRDVPSP